MDDIIFGVQQGMDFGCLAFRGDMTEAELERFIFA